MSRKAEIVAELARSRAAIVRGSSAVREEFNVVARLQRSVKSRPFAWLGGAAAIGYFLAGPKTRTKTVTKVVREKGPGPAKVETKKQHGFWDILFSLIKLCFPLVRPALSAYAARRIGDFADKLGK
ncbi:MAG: hypothetical protein D4R65_09560 [Verrucomicrobiaceae bacterium]|nr:MAG: hypothetical protein D4R65_09560 [Verrucomicrobiaceae bacterium]